MASTRTGGRVFVTPKLGTWYLAFNHDRPAFKGPGQIPLKKAINYAIDRPALVRTVRLPRRASAPTKCCRPTLARPEEHLPARGGANLAAARRWYARARVRRPATLVLYTWNDRSPRSSSRLRCWSSTWRKLGIDLDVKYFDASGPGGEGVDPRRAV